MSEAKYEPTEEQIKKVLSRTSDPRKLAVAYLKANRRAMDSDMAFKAMDAVAELGISALSGDMNGAKSAAERLKRDMYAHNDYIKSI